MEHKMGDIIRKLRKEMGLGQEELAHIVGVSVPAVSKWECDKAYPDITLLPAIAKALHTNVDTLFSYPKALNEADVDKITKSFAEILDKEGMEKGLSFMQAELDKHPNCPMLQLGFGTILPLYRKSAEENQRAEIIEKSIELCKPAANCENPKWQLAAKKMLVNLYIMNEQYDLAQHCLESYNKDNCRESNQTMAVLCVKRGQLDKAEELYQRNLFGALADCETALTGLAGIAGTRGNEPYYIELLHKMIELTSLFELENYPGKGLSPYSSLCYYYGKKEKPEQMLWALNGLLHAVQVWNGKYTPSRFFSRMAEHDNDAFSSLIKNAITTMLQEFNNYDFINQNPEYQQIAKQLEQIALA